jgi:hypothetical protein
MNPNFQDPIESRPAVPAGRKIAIFLLVVLIVAVMIVWFGFLGWGAVEVIRSTLVAIKGLWTGLR